MKRINNFGRLARVIFVLLSSFLITVFIYGNSIFRSVRKYPAQLIKQESKDSIKKTDTSRKRKVVYKPVKSDTTQKVNPGQNPSNRKKVNKTDTIRKPPINRNLME